MEEMKMEGVSKSPALSRIESILDENSFVELFSLVTRRNTDFNALLNEGSGGNDGVITGHGLINGELCFVFAQDPSVMKGSIGEMHAKKIRDLFDMALKVGAPIVGILDSSGIRLSESLDSIEAVGSIIRKITDLKGRSVFYTVVCGQAGGGVSAIAALSDFCFAAEGSSLFVNSPDAIPGNSAAKNDTSSPSFQFENTGVVDGTGTLEEIATSLRALFSMIPGSDREGGRMDDPEDDLNRAASGISEKRSDIRAFATEIADRNLFSETKAGFAPNAVTGFIKLGGQTVGVAGISADKDGNYPICANGAEKIADFVNFCDSFGIPVLSLVNCDGFKRTEENEKNLPGALASLSYAFAQSAVPKVTVLLNKAYGTGYLFFSSKSTGADVVYAYEDTDIASMDPSKAGSLVSEELGTDSAKATAEFSEKQCGAKNAARHGYVDRILEFVDTRKYLIAAFDMLATKEEF